MLQADDGRPAAVWLVVRWRPWWSTVLAGAVGVLLNVEALAAAMLLLMSKSKLTPIRSKKLSLRVMKRTSIGHLQVLQAPQLLQEIDDFLVDFLGLADDEAEVGLEGGDRARPADVVPGGGLDGRCDQVDQAVEVGLGSRRRARPGPAPPAGSSAAGTGPAVRTGGTTWANMSG